VGQVAYQLSLPNHSKLHPVFHVSCLKKVIGTKCQIQTNLPELAEEASFWLQPQEFLDQCERRLHQRTFKEVLENHEQNINHVHHVPYCVPTMHNTHVHQPCTSIPYNIP
jgi:hypothetical protein